MALGFAFRLTMKAVPFTLQALPLIMTAVSIILFKARIRSPLLHMMGSIIQSRLFRTALLILGSLILGSLIH